MSAVGEELWARSRVLRIAGIDRRGARDRVDVAELVRQRSEGRVSIGIRDDRWIDGHPVARRGETG